MLRLQVLLLLSDAGTCGTRRHACWFCGVLPVVRHLVPRRVRWCRVSHVLCATGPGPTKERQTRTLCKRATLVSCPPTTAVVSVMNSLTGAGQNLRKPRKRENVPGLPFRLLQRPVSHVEGERGGLSAASSLQTGGPRVGTTPTCLALVVRCTVGVVVMREVCFWGLRPAMHKKSIRLRLLAKTNQCVFGFIIDFNCSVRVLWIAGYMPYLGRSLSLFILLFVPVTH